MIRRILVVLSLMVAAISCTQPALADGITTGSTISDPADLHVGTGAGTSCATGCAGDPNVIGAGHFDVYYNPNPSSSQSPIGNPFYLIVATPVYSGSTNTDTINSTSTLYAPYPGGSTTTVSVGSPTTYSTEFTSGSVYSFIGLGSSVTNSFNFVNMQACDIGTPGGNGCPNSALTGSNAPLFGQTITGYDITTWVIGTNSFSPGDLLDFSGTIPVGSYVTAIGVNGNEAWAVPFTESGIVTTTNVSEPGFSSLLGIALLALGALAGRRVLGN